MHPREYTVWWSVGCQCQDEHRITTDDGRDGNVGGDKGTYPTEELRAARTIEFADCGGKHDYYRLWSRVYCVDCQGVAPDNLIYATLKPLYSFKRVTDEDGARRIKLSLKLLESAPHCSRCTRHNAGKCDQDTCLLDHA